jgi:hypothetical protein
MTTNAYAAKRAIRNRLAELAAGMGPLSTLGCDGGPLQIKYDNRPRDMEDRCVYGGGVSFSRSQDDVIVDGSHEIPKETAVTTWYIRVADKALDIEDTDEIAETIGEALGDIFASEPRIAGGKSVSKLFAGQGDYDYDDDENISLLMYEVHTESYVE